jgi:cysteine sulfinate desulfinase/cysteine desulfurase-like protein
VQVPVEFAAGTLRLSTGRHTTESDVETAATRIIAAVQEEVKGSKDGRL